MVNVGRIAARWMTTLALGLWLGGIVFLGAVSAPAIFKFCRAHNVEILAPQIVGALVARFAPLSLVFGAALLFAWIIEGLLARPANRARRLWLAQGVCVAAMLGLALYLNFGALPELVREQGAVIRESMASGTPLGAASGAVPGVVKSAARRHFDTLHENYTRLTMVIVWLGLAALLSFVWRLSLPAGENRSS